MKLLKVVHTSYVEIKDNEMERISNSIKNELLYNEYKNALDYEVFLKDGRFEESNLELEIIDKDDEKVI